MGWSTEFECDRCDFSNEVVISDLRYYLLPDGRQASCKIRPAWCDRCGLVVEAEQIEPLEVLAAVSDSGSSQGLRIPEGILARYDWLKLRKLPPHCLRCGATDLQFAETDTVNHRVCGGTLRDRNKCVHFQEAKIWTYDVDGMPLNHRWHGRVRRWFDRRLSRV